MRAFVSIFIVSLLAGCAAHAPRVPSSNPPTDVEFQGVGLTTDLDRNGVQDIASISSKLDGLFYTFLVSMNDGKQIFRNRGLAHTPEEGGIDAWNPLHRLEAAEAGSFRYSYRAGAASHSAFGATLHYTYTFSFREGELWLSAFSRSYTQSGRSEASVETECTWKNNQLLVREREDGRGLTGGVLGPWKTVDSRRLQLRATFANTQLTTSHAYCGH